MLRFSAIRKPAAVGSMGVTTRSPFRRTPILSWRDRCHKYAVGALFAEGSPLIFAAALAAARAAGAGSGAIAASPLRLGSPHGSSVAGVLRFRPLGGRGGGGGAARCPRGHL